MRAPTQAQLFRALEAYDEAVHGGGGNTATRLLAMRAALVAAAHPPVAKPTCGAVRECDEMACGRCGTRWDVNDPEPPGCTHDCNQGRSCTCAARTP